MSSPQQVAAKVWGGKAKDWKAMKEDCLCGHDIGEWKDFAEYFVELALKERKK
jgi:hypothetical protein